MNDPVWWCGGFWPVHLTLGNPRKLNFQPSLRLNEKLTEKFMKDPVWWWWCNV